MSKQAATLLLLAFATAACATTQASVPVERPALEVPPVPARVIEPAPLPQAQGPEPVAELPAPSPANPRPRPPQRDPKPADPKVETPPVDPAAPPAQAPVPPLRTPATPSGEQAKRLIREINERALTTLNTLDYQNLSDERKAQWQNAKLLINQSEDAIKAANFEFAKNLAEKAERLAKELQGRLVAYSPPVPRVRAQLQNRARGRTPRHSGELSIS